MSKSQFRFNFNSFFLRKTILSLCTIRRYICQSFLLFFSFLRSYYYLLLLCIYIVRRWCSSDHLSNCSQRGSVPRWYTTHLYTWYFILFVLRARLSLNNLFWLRQSYALTLLRYVILFMCHSPLCEWTIDEQFDHSYIYGMEKNNIWLERFVVV